MKNALASFFVGFLFALGLGLAGMMQPQKIIGFLDLFGQWDPSLLFVMIGAILVHFLAYKIIRRKQTPLFSPKWHIPEARKITFALIGGSFLFGVGWGLGGFCPGPSISALASFDHQPLIFVISMIAGMFFFRLIDQKLKIEK